VESIRSIMMSSILNVNKSNMKKDWIEESFIQDYSGGARIDGVRVEELRYFSDDGGYFLEVGRLSEEVGKIDGFGDLTVRQVNYSEVVPGVIKAFHVHPEQDEIWFVPPTQRLVVVLWDVRKGSKTEGERMRFVAGAGKARMIYIPHGVAHGLSNPYANNAHMMYFVSHNFDTDVEKTQEYRMKWDSLGEEIWGIEKG